MVKAVNILKIISALCFLSTLLYVYSSLPVMVNLNPDIFDFSVHREYLFYGLLTGFVVISIFFFALEKMLLPVIKFEELAAWVKGLSPVVNLYLCFLIGYLAVINNPGHFQSGSYGYLTYLGPILIAVWLGGLIFLISKSKKTT
ncbi:MAG: hypothetical protein ABJG41_03345 [Cyclobacteriaceae bacterium]